MNSVVPDYDTTRDSSACNHQLGQAIATTDHSFYQQLSVDVNTLNMAGETCLHLAASIPSAPLVSALIRAGANPCLSLTDMYPIHLAVDRDSQECVT